MKDLGLTARQRLRLCLVKLSDVSALHEEILEGRGYNEITLHDINSLGMSKYLWKWAKTVSVHDGSQELRKELLLDSSRFGMEGVIAQLQTNSKTQTSWTSQTQSNPFGNKESVGPSWQVCGLETEKSFIP